MLKTVSILALGALVGFGGAYAGLRTEVLPRVQVWQTVPKVSAVAKATQDDADCFPAQTLVTDQQRRLISENARAIFARLPEESRAKATNLLREGAPMPYSAQKAIRSALILHSLDYFQQCLGTGIEDCPKGDAEHLFTPRNSISHKPEVDAAYMIGRWTEHLREDVERASFCVLVWQPVRKS